MLVVGAALVTASPASANTYSNRILHRLNEFRVNHGLHHLKSGYRLKGAAETHSRWMARHAVLTHGSWYARIRSYGVRSYWVGEILAEYQGRPETVIQAWMHSPPHRQIIRMRGFRHIGVGAVRAHGYWWVTVDFGSRRG